MGRLACVVMAAIAIHWLMNPPPPQIIEGPKPKAAAKADKKTDESKGDAKADAPLAPRPPDPTDGAPKPTP